MSNLEILKELRERTHLGLADCKQALAEANGDLEQAVTLLFKANKLRSRNTSLVTAAEGAVFARVYEPWSVTGRGVIVEVNCQTDFAANSAEFQQLLPTITNLMNRRGGVAQSDDSEVQDLMDRAALVLREKVALRRASELRGSSKLPQTVLRAYNHLGGKIAVLVGVESSVSHPAIEKLTEDLALQIAAMNPSFLTKEEVPQSKLEAQTKLFEEQLKEDLKPKPLATWPKIIEGKLNKWCSEVCLLEQESILEPKLTVAQLIERVKTETQAEINVADFRRYERGEKLGFIKHGE